MGSYDRVWYMWHKWLKWIIPVLIIIIIGGSVISGVNRLNAMNQDILMKASQIDNVLQSRADKIPNLVNTVKGYIKHEEAIFSEIAAASQRLANAVDIEEKAAASDAVSNAYRGLLVLAQKYPEIQADTQFIMLQTEISGMENRLMIARRDYNQAVQKYNTAIGSFPTRFYAGLFGYHPKEYFQAEEGSRENPSVEF